MKKALEYYMPHFKIILYIVVFVVCFGLALLLFSIGSRKRINLPLANRQNTQPASIETQGSMKLMPADKTTFSVGQDITLTVNADSMNNPVAGYDLLFLYDPASIAVVKVTSVDPTFDVFTFNNPNYVSVTGTKKLSISSQLPFINSSILLITIRGKKAGMTPVVIAPQLGPEQTKMVDDKAQIMKPQLGESLQLTIQ